MLFCDKKKVEIKTLNILNIKHETLFKAVFQIQWFIVPFKTSKTMQYLFLL